ncbi:MAG: hypothetical protein HQ479_01330 [Rhodobacter sp.]|nr:hypothetical protein [Rhodobacter sp.]
MRTGGLRRDHVYDAHFREALINTASPRTELSRTLHLVTLAIASTNRSIAPSRWDLRRLLVRTAWARLPFR